jgi:hypothetical protein
MKGIRLSTVMAFQNHKIVMKAKKKFKEAEKMFVFWNKFELKFFFRRRRNLFNINPDYNYAAKLYEDAFLFFRQCDMDIEAIQSLNNSAKCNLMCKNSLLAGKITKVLESF